MGCDFYLVIDFEASGISPDSRTWEIVEFPIVVVEASTCRVLPAEFHSYVRPTENPLLSRECKQNCGISQSDVDAAPPLAEVVQQVVRWVAQLRLNGNALVLTCGDYDLGTALVTEAERKCIPLPPWLRCWCNVKVPFEARYGKRMGMKGMLQRLGLTLEGRHHSGIDDARNIAKIVVTLLRQGLCLEVTGQHSMGAPLYSSDESGKVEESTTSKVSMLQELTDRKHEHVHTPPDAQVEGDNGSVQADVIKRTRWGRAAAKRIAR
eukprot:TRINITY_DN46497_c0_g1_i1.p1 TRINITY_DN46497_c0_g1~~TRINITY_DN46497_c0_g1_i1.p1  ORF type:complete len:265 (-),score=27.70 TRINITY_DN46497_c0_g1_i1:234-1028(-)